MTYRSFISLVLAGALAITGMTTAPARAGDRDAKIIAGAAALAIIGIAIASSGKRDKHVGVTRHHTPQYSPKRKRHNRYALPGKCWREGRTHRGKVRGYGRHCLHKRYGGYNALPHGCAVKTRGRDGRKRVIYRAGCLRKHGFR